MTGSTPATGIAAALRARIDSGELAPGARVPSTREITREWGVAMATATKALTALRMEGLVEPVRGIGTVVASRPTPAPPAVRAGAPSTGPGALTTARVVETAVAVADAEGLTALSMRRVAAELDVSTMSLYRHVSDKEDLVVRMLDAALGRWAPPVPPPAGWRARLEVAVVALWSAFRTHPWLAGALSMTRPQPTAGGLLFTEWCLTALDGLGLSPQQVFDVQLILFHFVRGVGLNLEAEAEAQAATGLDNEEWMTTRLPALQAIVEDGEHPMMSRILAEGYDLDPDVLVESGLGYLLDGLAVRLRELGGASPAAVADTL